MATLRVVLDTNVLLSGIAYPASIPGEIMAARRRGSVEVILSAFILDELRRVLPHLTSRHGLITAEIDDLVDSGRDDCTPSRSLGSSIARCG
jgi:uncharacterized protein